MKKFIVASIAAFLMSQSGVFASDFGVGVSAGTSGLGVEAKYGLSDKVMLRGAYYYLSYERDAEIDDIDYTGDLDMSNFAAFADFAPFANGFVMSGGAHLGGKELGLHATPASDVQIGHELVTPAQVGTLKGKAELEDFAPYLGFGYDNFQASKNISFNIRLGVLFTGSPKIELTSVDGLLSTDPAFIADLQEEIARMEEDVSNYKYYPVLTLGFAKKF